MDVWVPRYTVPFFISWTAVTFQRRTFSIGYVISRHSNMFIFQHIALTIQPVSQYTQICLSVFLSVCVSLPAYLPAYLPVCLSVRPSVRPSVCLSVCLWQPWIIRRQKQEFEILEVLIERAMPNIMKSSGNKRNNNFTFSVEHNQQFACLCHWRYKTAVLKMFPEQLKIAEDFDRR
jgi:hypothetical protein